MNQGFVRGPDNFPTLEMKLGWHIQLREDKEKNELKEALHIGCYDMVKCLSVTKMLTFRIQEIWSFLTF